MSLPSACVVSHPMETMALESKKKTHRALKAQWVCILRALGAEPIPYKFNRLSFYILLVVCQVFFLISVNPSEITWL